MALAAVSRSPQDVQTWLWLAFFASFAVKLPMWPVHTWLPDAHVEAPTAGSVVLAAILLKMGGYGFLRFSLPMFPDASQLFQPLMFALSVIAIVYASLVAFRQIDIKKLIAYSSVAHMGFVTLGIFSGNEAGIQGAIFQMLSHGVISGALFLCVGVVYDRMHTREIAFYGGLVHRMPVYAAMFMLFTMGNVGLPGTSGFRRRDPHHGRRLPGLDLGRGRRGARRHPLGGLRADALSPGRVRRDDQREAGRHQGRDDRASSSSSACLPSAPWCSASIRRWLFDLTRQSTADILQMIGSRRRHEHPWPISR